MKTQKHLGVKISLLAVLVILVSIVIAVWCMFGTQLKAVSTIKKLEDHLYVMEYKGDYGFDGFWRRAAPRATEKWQTT